MSGLIDEVGRDLSVPNLHDVGAVDAPGVRLRTGVLYRSADLASAERAARTIRALGLRTVVDLRTEAERTARPDVVPEPVRTIVADVLADQRSAAPAATQVVFDDPEASARHIRADDIEKHMLDSYEGFVTLASARQAYRALFEEVAASGSAPLLFHCAVGKDRTGWATAVLHLLAGLDHAHVMTAYLAIREHAFALFKPVLERFEEAGGDPAALHPMADVRPGYLDAAIASMSAHYGDVRGYLADGLGLDQPTIHAVRSAMVDDA